MPSSLYTFSQFINQLTANLARDQHQLNLEAFPEFDIYSRVVSSHEDPQLSLARLPIPPRPLTAYASTL